MITTRRTKSKRIDRRTYAFDEVVALTGSAARLPSLSVDVCRATREIGRVAKARR